MSSSVSPLCLSAWNNFSVEILRRFHLVTVQQVLRWLFTKSLERLVSKEVTHEGALCFSFWKKPQKTKRIAAHTSIPASLFSDLGQFFFFFTFISARINSAKPKRSAAKLRKITVNDKKNHKTKSKNDSLARLKSNFFSCENELLQNLNRKVCTFY